VARAAHQPSGNVKFNGLTPKAGDTRIVKQYEETIGSSQNGSLKFTASVRLATAQGSAALRARCSYAAGHYHREVVPLPATILRISRR
jgi:hypothetical protein